MPIPADPTTFQKLQDRAKEIGDKSLELPELATVDQKIVESSQAIFEKLLGVKAPEPVKTPEPTVQEEDGSS